MRPTSNRTIPAMNVRLAATYLGTVVGAGFASGQEHLHFFARFSRGGDLGVALSGLLFITLGVMLADLASRHATSSAEDLLELLGGPVAARAMDAILTVFTFCSLCVMMAGSAALFKEHAYLPSSLGMSLTALVTVAAVVKGVEGLLSLNTVIAPVLLGAPVTVASLSLIRAIARSSPCPGPPWPEGGSGNAFIPAWPVASVLYVSYNLILVVAAFASMGRDLDDPRAARRGAALGGVALLVFMAAIHISLELHGPAIWRAEVPMLLAASRFGLGLRVVYFAALWVAMVTTAAAACFAFCRRLGRRNRSVERALAVSTVLASALLAQVGFGDLVSRVYPVFGYLGLPLVLGLVRAWLRSRFALIFLT